jgi:hypothetical protein
MGAEIFHRFLLCAGFLRLAFRRRTDGKTALNMNQSSSIIINHEF